MLLILWGLGGAAVGAPRPPAPAATPGPGDEKPLVPYELTDAAAIARAYREYYTKYEYRIPMRDGVRLYTVVYVPKDAPQRWPILLIRTPYSIGPYGIDNYPTADTRRLATLYAPSPAFVRAGFILAAQDVRGRFMSEGNFVDVRPLNLPHSKTTVDESTDASDTLEFLVKNVPRNNGRVGTWGVSYPGFYAAQSAVDAHPALKAVSPQAPVTDWFAGDDFHHNGALFLSDAFLFYASFGKPRPAPTAKVRWEEDPETGDGYQFFLELGPLSNVNARHFKGEIAFWNDIVAHPDYDAFWQARNPRPAYKGLTPAMLTVGGWFDAEDCFGALETYRAIERQNPGLESTLVVGPWGHGGWARSDGDRHGDVEFGARTSHFYNEQVVLPFFERHLKGRSRPALPEAQVFETGTNEWRGYDAWPPRGATPQRLFLGAAGSLSARPPAGAAEGDAFPSDPQHPVPFTDKFYLGHGEYMSGDQRFASRRPDVLGYKSAPLEADVTLAGPLRADLWVSSSSTDADFVVKLIDVYPDNHQPGAGAGPSGNGGGGGHEVRLAGYQQLVRGEVMRARYRNRLDKPEPMVPGQPTRISFSLPDINHSFRAGHRLMVQVQSSWFPLVDRNPQSYVDIYQAKESDFRAATHTVYRGGDHPSSLEVTLLRGSLP